MKKRELKKQIKELNRKLQYQDLERALRHARPPMQSLLTNKDVASEAVAEDQYRQEAYAKVQEWVAEYLQTELQKVRNDYEQVLNVERKTSKRYERRISEYSSEIRFLKREIKNMGKKLTILEDTVNKMKTTFQWIGVYAGVAKPCASLKKITKAFKRRGEENFYMYGRLKKKERGEFIHECMDDNVIDGEWKER